MYVHLLCKEKGRQALQERSVEEVAREISAMGAVVSPDSRVTYGYRCFLDSRVRPERETEMMTVEALA